jgi:hypothetical protein
VLYQINTHVWLTELSGTLGRAATLDDIPDSASDHFAKMAFDGGVVPERVADRRDWTTGFTRQS